MQSGYGFEENVDSGGVVTALGTSKEQLGVPYCVVNEHVEVTP
jgi:hypothetical protein